MIEFAPNAMLMTNRDGIIEMVNAQTEKIFCYARAELLGKPIEQLVPTRFRAHHPGLRESFHTSPASRSTGEGRDLYGVRKDGVEVPIEIALNPIDTDEGMKVLSAVVDISDRKQKEDRIRLALKEKEILLGEVHHRVKNNLQIVHSLLDLQASQIDDPVVRNMLLNSMHRIQSMAIIHQTLYQSDSFSEIELGDVLKKLIANVESSYIVDPQRLTITVQAAPLGLSIAKVIPCGLIVNELITNALKHAFPDAARGAISVELATDEQHRVVLSVSDDGIGLADGIKLTDTNTLGLELVTLLVEQLGGALTIQRAKPTRFTICFPIDDERVIKR